MDTIPSELLEGCRKINRPQWKFVKGGSHRYIQAIISKNLFNYEINKCVKKILRDKDKITVIFNDNERFVVDKIILATHADQALNILDAPSKDEFQILSKFQYSKNYAYYIQIRHLCHSVKQLGQVGTFKVKIMIINLSPLLIG